LIRYEAEDGIAIIYGSMYGFAALMADRIGVGLADRGVKNIRIIDASATHVSYQIEAAWRYRGLILGSSSYNTRMLPTMETFCRDLEHIGLKNRLLGIFGTGSWSGGGVRNLSAFAESIGWEIVADPVEIIGAPTTKKLKACDTIAEAMAARLAKK
jgi:flavorubredoxin